MIHMKRFLASVFFICALALTGTSQVKFGAGLSLLDSNFGVQGKAHYTLNDQFAPQASFSYFFESGVTLWALDLDLHYSGFEIGDVESFRITPFAGLNFYRVSSFGTTNLNLGVNGTMPLTDTMDLYIEPKITIGNGGTFGLAAGVYF